MNRLPAYQIAQRGMARTFQDLRLIKSLHIIDNILLARPQQSGEHFLPALVRQKKLLHEEARNRQKALELLDFVGLADKQNNLEGENFASNLRNYPPKLRLKPTNCIFGV